jgi:hypothetical protein
VSVKVFMARVYHTGRDPQHASPSVTLPPMARTRRRAWALSITAAMLAVVWVVSMKVSVRVFCSLPDPQTVHAGCVNISLQSIPMPYRSSWGYSVTPWEADWWFQHKSLFFDGTPVNRVRIPLWPFILLTGVPGVWMLAKSRRGKGDAGANLCPSCGYDLTGLPPTKRGPVACPECGKTA